MFGQQDNTQPPADIAIPDQVVADAAGAAQPDASAWQHPGMPIGSDQPQVTPSPIDFGNPVASPTTPIGDGSTSPNELLDIKQQALTQLSPLVGHLEQSPEEKFRTTMMMIQASDDQSLVKTAFDSAQAIPDEKTRAQALLDIVNEINYFTQHQAS